MNQSVPQPTVGKYRLIRKIATGGMAEVYLAESAGPAGFQKSVVLKRILPHFADNPQFLQMFLNEAKLAALLNHPNIVSIFDLGEAAGSYFLAMEYIDGCNLRILAKRSNEEKGKQVSYAHAAKILSLACEGLGFAHDFAVNGRPLNLIHRDISPDNIMLSRSGAVKVVDFGIAKAANQENLTKTGTLKGKLAYMPPEQLRCEPPLDRRADIFALGVVMYELLANAKPFEGEGEVQIIQNILASSPVPLQERRPDCPTQILAIVEKCLAKNRDERYPDCRSLQQDLERFLMSQGTLIGAFDLARMVEEVVSPATPPVAPAPLPRSVPIEREVLEANGLAVRASAVHGPPPPPPRTMAVGIASGASLPAVSMPDSAVSATWQMTMPLPAVSGASAGKEMRPAQRTPPMMMDMQLPVPMQPGQIPMQAIPMTPPPRSMSSSLGSAGKVGLAVAGALLMTAAVTGGVYHFRTRQQPANSVQAEPVTTPAIPPGPSNLPTVAAPIAPPVSPMPPQQASAPQESVPPPAEAKTIGKVSSSTSHPGTRDSKGSKRLPQAAEPAPALAAENLPAGPTGEARATLVIDTEPPCTIDLDGHIVGSGTVELRDLAAGAHQIAVSNAEKGLQRFVALTVAPGETRREQIAFRTGTITFRVRPWANVEIDGKPSGTTPLPSGIPVYEGQHSIKLTNPELRKVWVRQVWIQPGKDEVVKANLEE